MSRRSLFLATCTVGALALTASGLVAQSPEAPRPLPPSITGAPVTPAGVTPAGGNQVQATPAAPISRFLADRSTFPPETEQAVFAVRSGADWLFRMNQASGRFMPGLNAAIRQSVEADLDLRQAFATLALAEAAKFTGDERYAARANGAVLAMLALTKPDAADAACRVPTMANDRCNRVGFAALLVMAILQLPNPDARLLADAEALTKFLRKQVQANGSINYTDAATDEPQKVDPEGATVYPGLALQAIAASLRAKPDGALREVFPRAIAHQVRMMKAQPQALMLATTIPALVEYAVMTNKDAAVVGLVFEATDALGACQVPRTETRRTAWVGGVRATAAATGEPTFETALAATAFCQAAKLTRQVPDAARFTRYRGFAVDALAFTRGLQYTDESAEHFEKTFRARYVNGGARLTPSEGTLRIDATAQLVSAHIAYLTCGTEQRLD